MREYCDSREETPGQNRKPTDLKDLKNKSLKNLNLETRLETETCTTRQTRNLAQHFEKLTIPKMKRFKKFESEV